MPTGKKKIGVLLLAFGGANSIEDVEPFITNVLKGRVLTEELLIKAKERYNLIGGSSPLLAITKDEASALEKVLNTEGSVGFKSYVGMRFWPPYIKDTIKEIASDGIEEVIGIIMAPHSSRASTGGYLSAVQEGLEVSGDALKVRYLPDWHTHPLLIEAITDNIKEAQKNFDPKDKVLTIFSAHSLPVPAVKGDAYLPKIDETIKAVTEKMELDSCLAFQSKGGGPVPWLGPDAEDVIKGARGEGYSGVLVVPLGFVSDHVETLYDLDILFKETAEEAGLGYARSASLNTNEKFIAMLAEMVTLTLKDRD
ncbi:MAG: ferrochelatase [Deltaproteobacteria bacterium]|nr:ferrochelatase [Deltaproteobacteria bacterium]